MMKKLIRDDIEKDVKIGDLDFCDEIIDMSEDQIEGQDQIKEKGGEK